MAIAMSGGATAGTSRFGGRDNLFDGYGRSLGAALPVTLTLARPLTHPLACATPLLIAGPRGPKQSG